MTALVWILISALVIAACTGAGSRDELTVTTSPAGATTTSKDAPTTTAPEVTTTIGATTTLAPETTTSTAVTRTAPVDTTTVPVDTTTTQGGTTTSEAPPESDAEPDVPLEPLDLPVGTCFDDPAPGVEVVTRDNLGVVDCSVPHDNEVFSTFEIGEADFPGESAVHVLSDEMCLDAFELYVGAPYESSQYDFSWYFPSDTSWDAGDTTVICFGYRVDIEKITGSIEGIAE